MGFSFGLHSWSYNYSVNFRWAKLPIQPELIFPLDGHPQH